MRMTRLNPIIDSVWSDRLTGTSGRDYVELTWGDDTIYGGAGGDVVWDLDGDYQNAFPGNPGDPIWLASSDRIYGGSGDDWVFAGWGADSLYGGSGIDRVDYRYSKSAVEVNLVLGRGYGDEKSASRGDVISGFEEFNGSGHDDLFFLSSSAVTVWGGNGDDSLYGGLGNSTVYGGQGDDLFVAGAGAFEFEGGEGVDTLSLALSPGGRSVFVAAADSIEVVRGSAFADDVTARVDFGRTITLRGEGGDDALEVLDIGYGTGGNASLFGGSGHDSLTGGQNSDALHGDSGNDLLRGDRGDDSLYGGTGHDSLQGGEGRNFLYGGSGNDRLQSAGSGDRLYGGSGEDVLIAGRHGVTMFGGAGADSFVFQGRSTETRRIGDFDSDDRLDVSAIDAFVPALFGADSGSNDAFVFMGLAGKSAPAGTLDYRHEGRDTIVHLHTDSDGIADIRIVLTGHHTLTADDFVL